jgi:hypothetical protein
MPGHPLEVSMAAVAPRLFSLDFSLIFKFLRSRYSLPERSPSQSLPEYVAIVSPTLKRYFGDYPEITILSAWMSLSDPSEADIWSKVVKSAVDQISETVEVENNSNPDAKRINNGALKLITHSMIYMHPGMIDSYGESLSEMIKDPLVTEEILRSLRKSMSVISDVDTLALARAESFSISGSRSRVQILGELFEDACACRLFDDFISEGCKHMLFDVATVILRTGGKVIQSANWAVSEYRLYNKLGPLDKPCKPTATDPLEVLADYLSQLAPEL